MSGKKQSKFLQVYFTIKSNHFTMNINYRTNNTWSGGHTAYTTFTPLLNKLERLPLTNTSQSQTFVVQAGTYHWSTPLMQGLTSHVTL
jgi:hypothetical protein